VSTARINGLALTIGYENSANETCSVTVYSPDGGGVSLTFVAFDTQNNSDCKCSAVPAYRYSDTPRNVYALGTQIPIVDVPLVFIDVPARFTSVLDSLRAGVTVHDAASGSRLAGYSGTQGGGRRVFATSGGNWLIPPYSVSIAGTAALYCPYNRWQLCRGRVWELKSAPVPSIGCSLYCSLLQAI
jgi:hypothetical protein